MFTFGPRGNDGPACLAPDPDALYSNVKLRLNFDEPSTFIKDTSPLAAALTGGGGPTRVSLGYSTPYRAYHDGVAATNSFIGPSGAITNGDSANYVLGTSDFCFEMWVELDAVQPQDYVSLWTISEASFFRTSNFTAGSITLSPNHISNFNKILLFVYNFSSTVPLISAAYDLKGAGRRHVAVFRSGSVFTVTVDGAAVGSGTYAGSVNTGTAAPFINGDRWSGSGVFKGYIDDVKLTIGSPRYSAPFTPPCPFALNGS